MVCVRLSRRIGVLAAAIALALPVHAIDCAKARAVVEKGICGDPTLVQLQRQVEDLTVRLKRQWSGKNVEVLADTEMPFLRLRNNCQNQSAPAVHRKVTSCVERVLGERLELLQEAQSSPDAIQKAVGQSYFIDLGFFGKYGDALVGKKLSVFGCMELAEGPVLAARLLGQLTGDGARPVPVIFRAMTAEGANFLDVKKPCAHWRLTIERQGEKLVFVSDHP